MLSSPWQPVWLALLCQALTALTLAYTPSESILRLPASACLAALTWRFHLAIQCTMENHLYLALLTTAMWIQCIKSVDDLCLTRVSVTAHQTQTPYGMKCEDHAGKDGLLASRSFHYPENSRIGWALTMLWNARGIGSPWKIAKVPPWIQDNPSFVPTRNQELLRHAKALIGCYLFLDVLASLPPPDLENMLSKKNERLFSRLGTIDTEEAITRAVIVLAFWLNTFCVIQIINSTFSFAQLCLKLQPVEMLPPIWGSLSDSYSIRNFWGSTWHQTLRRSLTSIADCVAHTLLGMRRGGVIARYTKLMLCFLVSGALHRSADLLLGIPGDESAALLFFTTTALAIIFEDTVQYFMNSFYMSGGRSWRLYVGYMWVACFMYWSTPFWAYPAARVARPEVDSLLPCSLVGRVLKLYA